MSHPTVYGVNDDVHILYFHWRRTVADDKIARKYKQIPPGMYNDFYHVRPSLRDFSHDYRVRLTLFFCPPLPPASFFPRRSWSFTRRRRRWSAAKMNRELSCTHNNNVMVLSERPDTGFGHLERNIVVYIIIWLNG